MLMKTTLEQYLGLWIDRNDNILLIKPSEANTVKVSFASGKIMAPIERYLMHKQFTIEVDGEFDTDYKELTVQFGVRYFEPKLHLTYKLTDNCKEKASLRPSYKLSVSTPKEKKEWMEWFEPLESYFFIEDKSTVDKVLSLYQWH